MTQGLLSHVALLVPSVRKAANHLRSFDFKIGPAEQWEGEGTLEIYVGDPQTQRGTLLLMEPINEGAYTRAMKKRGPGLHHIAVDVLDLDAYIDELAGSGWLLHPKSLRMMKKGAPAYLARPGIPTLIEVQQRDELAEIPHFIEELSIPALNEQQLRMFRALGLDQVRTDMDGHLTLSIASRKIHFKDLL